jgi:hypothetical protein
MRDLIIEQIERRARINAKEAEKVDQLHSVN